MVDAKRLKLWLEQWFSEDQSPEHIAQRAFDAGRRAGMEEAAALCDGEATVEGIAQQCATKIREAAK